MMKLGGEYFKKWLPSDRISLSAVLDTVEKKKISCLCQQLKPDFLVGQPLGIVGIVFNELSHMELMYWGGGGAGG
jgi:hypothetical protein